MANNTLIKGAALTGKKFLDVRGAVAKGFQDLGNITNTSVKNDRVAKNKAIQSRVNNYMSRMKTDMDFTSFSLSETKAMRNFLSGERSRYINAAKMAASFNDTTDPEYMQYVDEMQSVNNSFTNLASQLGSYKKSKLEYAQAMQEGLYSNGNDDNRSLEAATIYGFIDEDKDGRSDKRLDAPFVIQNGGNIAFNVGDQEVLFNNMEEPFLKNTKFLNGLSKTSETAYNSGLSGKSNNPYAQKSYNQSLDDSLQNEDTLRSIIFDFQAEAPMDDIGEALDDGVITLEEAREKVKASLLNAREEAYAEGKAKYDIKQRKTTPLRNNPTSYFETAPVKKEIGLINARFDGDFSFKDRGTQNFQLRRQGKYGDTKTREYYYNQNAEGIIFISPNKDMVETENAAPSNTFNPATPADVIRAKEEFGIDISPADVDTSYQEKN